MEEFIRRLPKTELHLHIEGTLEPQMMFDLAARNRYELPYANVDSVAAAYRFRNLQSFLDIYYRGAAVLQTPQDFHDLAMAYFERAAVDGVRHAEIFFDPQTHTERGIGYEIFMDGFRSAQADALDRFGVSSGLILCFLRHLGGAEALATLEEAEPHLEGVIAVGLDSSELGNPPEMFVDAYELARSLGLRAVAHAGEEGPPEYVLGALDTLGVERVDHGVRSLEDPDLTERLREEQIPLTVCPLSNVALRVVDRIVDHPLPAMLDAGIMASVNSDDPAYFGGYVAENYLALAEDLTLDTEVLAHLAANSIKSSFLDDGRKNELLEEIIHVAP
ncbi:MAG: adenosine deaminase [Acidimicrobiia bacterium]|jgi:adenosine deaminase